jgi:signal transduction histidine kinase
VTFLRRLVPKSLIAQIAVVIALVLLVLQAINFAAVRSERQRVTQAQLEVPVITRFLAATNRLVERGRERPIENRRGRIGFGPASIVAAEANDIELAERLRETAAANGIEIREARAAISDAVPPLPATREDGSQRILPVEDQRAERFRSLLLSLQLPDGRWVNGQLLILRPNPYGFLRLAASTLAFYLVLLGALIFVLRRLLRPLRDLTQAAQRFRGAGKAPQVTPRGPADIRRAIEAFNDMGGRVGGLLDEKDRMLGAIGHDLRTPLASLRIRAESMEPPEERERMIATIEEMTGLLDDTLALARSGRSHEPPRPLDVTALADAVVEEFRELGHDVAMEESGRAVACVRPNLVRGAVRNLIDNAVKYAGAVRVAVTCNGDRVTVEVLDRGPGIPEDHLARVQEPFVRLEESRSRQTGGSGLGITLARAAARIHGGELELANRPEGGLVARLCLPREEKA